MLPILQLVKGWNTIIEYFPKKSIALKLFIPPVGRTIGKTMGKSMLNRQYFSLFQFIRQHFSLFQLIALRYTRIHAFIMAAKSLSHPL